MIISVINFIGTIPLDDTLFIMVRDSFAPRGLSHGKDPKELSNLNIKKYIF